jgi:predicted RNA-binding Zn-ribbon protein involved in translation (DUF1610 family)
VVNEQTHQFWAHRSFLNRLATIVEEYGIGVEVRSEAYPTAECPACGEREQTERDGDVFRCQCGYEGHADLGASRTFLDRQAGETAVGSMARPVRLTWDDHDWLEPPHSPKRASPNEERTHRGTGDGTLASVGGEPPSPPEESNAFSRGGCQSHALGSGRVIYAETGRVAEWMNCEEATEFSFRCPSCEESLTVNGPMRAALVERGCVVCGAELTLAAFTAASDADSCS